MISMVSKRKKAYMREYNQQPYVKAKKAEYMRKVRAVKARQLAKETVLAFLHAGYENQAFEYAKEFAPETLLIIKARAPNRKAP